MEYAKTGSLTAGGSLSGSAQSATSGTAVAYSTLSGTPAIEIDPAYHIHPPRPHHQHQGTTAAPVTYFNLEPFEPALPLEWVLFYPVALIVAAHMTARTASRYVAARHVL